MRSRIEDLVAEELEKPTDLSAGEEAPIKRSLGEALQIAAQELRALELRTKELRAHERFQIDENALEIKFGSLEAFSKSYVRDISLGGLFVKTSLKPNLKEVLPIVLTLPATSEEKGERFVLKGRVVRLASDGVAFEFIDLTPQRRAQLEDYLASNPHQLSSGTAPIRKDSIRRVEERRLSKVELAKKRKALRVRIAALFALFLLNILMGLEINREAQERSASPRRQTFSVDGRNVAVSEISKVTIINDRAEIELMDKTKLIVDRESFSALPPHLIEAAKGQLHPRKAKRVSQNNPPRRVRLK